MRKIEIFMILSIFMLIFSLITCERSTEPGENLLAENGLFRAKFTNNYIPEDVVGIIFLSDTEGNAITDTMWLGDADIKFEVPASMATIPENISVTLAY